jgi:hypothetical protein
MGEDEDDMYNRAWALGEVSALKKLIKKWEK